MTNLARITDLEREVQGLYNFYKANCQPETVRLFSEDFDFLEKQKKLAHFAEETTFCGYRVAKGPKRKKPRKRRPPEFNLG